MRCRLSRGFTMLELLVALAILAVMAGLAVPAYFQTVEQARSNEAKTNLNIIHMGEKLYYLNNNTYWGPGSTTIAAANTALNTDMSATYYTTISVTGAAGSYTAKFTRNAVAGGAGSKWFQYDYATNAAAPTAAEGGNY